MRSCIFCCNKADSREHVIAKRLVKRMNLQRVSAIAAHLHETNGLKKRPSHTFDGFKTRYVCAPCNNGWMNHLEEWFENRLGFLIEPAWPRLGHAIVESIVSDKRDGEQLARWALKTSAILDYSLSLGQRAMTREFTLKLKAGPVPDAVTVELAQSQLVGAAAIIFAKGFPVVNGGVFDRNQEHKNPNTFRTIFQFNGLLIRVIRAPMARVQTFSDGITFPIRIYPEPHSLPASYLYSDVTHFDRSLVLEIDPPR